MPGGKRRQSAPEPDPSPGLLSRKQARDELIAAGVPAETAEQMIATARRDGNASLAKHKRRVTHVGDDIYKVAAITRDEP